MDITDCVVLGYSEMPFNVYEQVATAKGSRSPEYRMLQRDYLDVAGEHLPYLDALTELKHRTGDSSNASWYHLGEVSNLAAVYLTSYLRRHGYTADFISMLPAEEDRLAQLLQNRTVLTVAITTTFYLTPLPVIDLVKQVRRYQPECTIIVGGPLISNLAHDLEVANLEYTLSEMGADVYVREAQGELTLSRVIHQIHSGSPLTEVPNCYLKDGGRFRFTYVLQENNELDECSIDWDSFDDWELGETVQMRTARSCAFKCSFCDYPLRAGALAVASIATVEQELKQLARRGVRNIVFVDDTFNVPIERFKNLCRMMIHNGFNFRWFSYFRCSNARDTETFDLLLQSGCGGVFLGIESADDGVLLNMNKKASSELYRRGISELNERGIPSFASFIVGFPGETDATVHRTVEFLNSASPTFYRAEPHWYNSRAPIASQANKFGLQGRGYQWHHDTMSIEQACDGVDYIFHNVDASLWMPMYMFDFWALPYLLGKGMTLEQVIAFHRHGEQAMKRRIAGTNSQQELNALQQLCARVDLRASRYQLNSVPVN